jgi:hypothetical protein
MSEVERLLQNALVPVEPSGALTDRLERRLSEITGLAAGELADWELSAMRDPRNWGRWAVAGAVGIAAGGALVLVRARQGQKKRQLPGLTALERGVREVVGDVRGRLERKGGLEKNVREVVGDVRQRLPRS